MEALAAVTEKLWSSLMMRPVAVASTMFWGVLSLSLALLMVTVKPSSSSTSRSVATVMLMVRVVSFGSKVRVPAGRLPPKSAALAALAPLPVTAQSTVAAWLTAPARVTVKV